MTQAFHGGRLQEAIRQFGIPADQLLDFSSNLNPFAPVIPPDLWLSWLTEVTRYPEADAESLKLQLADFYALNPKHLLPTSGGIEALYLAARLFSRKRTVVLEPAFSDYARAFSGPGTKLDRLVLPSNLWTEPITHWADQLKSYEVVVLGNPNNPTGILQNRVDLVSIWQQPWAQKQAWVIDEAFIESAPNSDQNTLLNILPPHVIVLRSLTKSWAIPGLRLGFLATSNLDWMEQLENLQAPWSINAIAHAWAKNFLTPNHEAALHEGLKQLQEVKSHFQAELSQLDGLQITPSSANFLLLHLASFLNSNEIYRRLGQRGLLTRRCDSFYGLPPGQFLRVAVRSQSENRRLVETLSEIIFDTSRRAA